MKTALLEIEATLSNAIAQLSMPNPNAETAKRGVEVARKKLLELAENQSGRDPLLEAKRKLVLVYLRMAEKQFSDADTEIFSILSKERALQDELERARKNN
jgi:predicted site-specific integrase-resolvase